MISSVKQSYTFTQGDEPVVIDLTGHVANNDCKYEITIRDLTTGLEADQQIFKVVAPAFK